MPMYVAIPCVEGRKGPLQITQADSLVDAVKQLFGEVLKYRATNLDNCRVKLANQQEFEVAKTEEIKVME